MRRAKFHKKTFHFKRPSGTSRGILTEKHAWFIEVWNTEKPEIIGIGECSVIPGLSPDFQSFADYESKLKDVIENIDTDLIDWPSIKFGLETALLDLKNGGQQIYFDNNFSKGNQEIEINGLVWMGDKSFMREQIQKKIESGFKTIKLKIGAIDFSQELGLLQSIRENFSESEITLRVDANGAYSPNEAVKKLTSLAHFQIHSIEQPIKAGQWNEMHALCQQKIIPIALDEELIGINDLGTKTLLLNTIQPQFIILKPSLHGGISGCQEWINLSEKMSIPWWLTSALESNIGLKAISQFAAEYDNKLPQGLGTGALYTDNIPSDLVVKNGKISLRN